MTGDDRIEDLVERFLERRAAEPDLRPETFAAEHPAAAGRLLPALHASLEVLATFSEVEDPLPERIGAWRVVRELGRGGMGIVYEVERAGERAALKRLSVGALMQPQALQRFHREAAVLQRLRHPGIVAVREVGTADGLPFLVMDLVDGVQLSATGGLPWRRAATLARDLARALAALHDAGLCHRDLKPQNVIVRSDEAPVIVDFGLVHDDRDDSLTHSGDLLGTPRYLAPEQAEGRPADARTDVHAVGLILAELVTGAPCRIGGDRSALLAEAARGLSRRRLPRVAGVPADLWRVIRTATARRPQHRYADGTALAADLERVLAGRSVLARPPGLVAAALDAMHFHPRATGVLAGVALVLIAGLGLWWNATATAGRSARASARFEQALLAWLERDPVAVNAHAAAALAEAGSHAGASALLALVADAPPAATADPLQSGLAHRHAQRWPEATAALREATAAEPTCPLRRVLLAEATEKAGQLVEADAELTTASRLLPQSPALAAALAALRARRGDARGAAEEYRRALALQPRSFAPHYRLARCLQGFDAEAALAAADAAVPLLPAASPRAQRDLDNLRGALLDKLGRTTDALAIFERLAAADGADVRAMFNVAYALDRLLRVREAKSWYERVLAREPDNVNASLCLAWLLATATDTDLRDVEAGTGLLIATLDRDTGRTPAVLQMVREFGLRTRHIDGLVGALARLSARTDLPQEQRALLEHTGNYLKNGVGAGR